MKLSLEALRMLRQKTNEPVWLSKQREEAFQSFEALPTPSVQDEQWRYTDLKSFQLNQYEMESPSSSTLTLSTLDKSCQDKGVIFCDIQTALNLYPSKISPLLKEAKEVLKNKFENLHHAFWQTGVFVYVPRGVTLDRPLSVRTSFLGSGSMIFPFTLVCAEPFSKVTLIDEMVSQPKDEGSQFSDGFRYIHVAESANLQYVNIQRWSEAVYHYECQLARLEQNAVLTSVNVGLGGYLTKANIQTVLDGKGAQAKLLGVFFGHEKQQFDYHTLQDHRAPDCQSDLLFKVALQDYAQSSYQGVIRIPKAAQRSDALQTNRNLLLSPDAKARTIPKLEIIADDVRCSHAATVGTIDETETFYLESRGLSFEDARQMIVQGFFEQVIAQIPGQEVRTDLCESIEKKLKGVESHG